MENDNRYTTNRSSAASRRQPSDIPTSRQQRVASSLRTGSTSAAERTSARASAGRYAAAGRTAAPATAPARYPSASRTRNSYSDSQYSARTSSSLRTASSRVMQVDPDKEVSSARTAQTGNSSVPGRTSSDSQRASASLRTRNTSALQRTSSSGTSSATKGTSSSRASSVSARPASASARSSSAHSGTASRSVKPVRKNSSDSALSEARSRFSNVKEKAQSKSGARSSAAGEKKGLFGLSRFTGFIIIYSAIFVVLIILVAIILSAALKSFESRQPSHVVENIVEDFSSSEKLRSFMEANSAKVVGTDSVLNFEDTYYSMVEGREISYIADSSRTTLEISAYKITADGVPVAGIELTKNNGNTWDLSSVDITAAYNDVAGYSILVPDGATVMVNGSQLGESSITGRGIPAILEYSAQFLKNPPQFVTYTVKLPSGGSIDVSGTDSNGNPLNFAVSDNTYVAGDGAAQSFIDEVKETVETGVDEYALYFEFLAFNLEDYILEGSELHEFIFGSEDFDPINPGLYMYEYINTHDFKEKSVTNYTVYSDDCFTVDVKYDLLITFNTEGPYGTQNLPDDELEMDATWVWVKSGDSWKISQIVNH